MQDDRFSLLSSPFAVLGADYGSSPAYITALVEEAVAAFPAREVEFLAAQQILLTPELRLKAELEWLP
jgi:hypothetical protein